MPAIAALMHSIARQKVQCIDSCSYRRKLIDGAHAELRPHQAALARAGKRAKIVKNIHMRIHSCLTIQRTRNLAIATGRIRSYKRHKHN